MLIRLESQSNSRIRLVRKLGTRKGRTAEGRFVIEGLNLCREAVLRSLDIDFLMVPDDWKTAGGSDDLSGLRAFTEECIADPGLTVCTVPAKIFAGLRQAAAHSSPSSPGKDMDAQCTGYFCSGRKTCHLRLVQH